MGALGATEATGVTIEPLPDGEGPWLAGRAARVVVNGTWVGCFGEIDPHVGDAFELAVPMNAAELTWLRSMLHFQTLCERHLRPYFIRCTSRTRADRPERYYRT